MTTTDGWIEDEPEDNSEEDLSNLAPQLSDADVVGEHLDRQVRALESEGYSRLAIATALSQLASIWIWELYEGAEGRG